MSGSSCTLDPPIDGWNMLDMNAILQYGALRLSPIPFSWRTIKHRPNF